MRRWTITKVVLAVCLSASSLSSQQEKVPPKQTDKDILLPVFSRGSSAEALVHQCEASDNYDPVAKQAPAKDVGNIEFCFGFVAGVLDSDELDSQLRKVPKRYCVPNSVSPSQLAKVVMKYGRDHPEELNFPAIALVGLAVTQSFPCD